MTASRRSGSARRQELGGPGFDGRPAFDPVDQVNGDEDQAEDEPEADLREAIGAAETRRSSVWLSWEGTACWLARLCWLSHASRASRRPLVVMMDPIQYRNRSDICS